MNAILKSGLGPPPRILTRPPVRARTGLARRTIDLCIAPGRFPRPIALGERAGGWIEVEVDAGLRPLIRPFSWFGNLSTEAEFHEAMNPGGSRSKWTSEPGEPVGVMIEDGGAVGESAAAGSEGHEPE